MAVHASTQEAAGDVALRDGSTVRVRPVEPSDEESIRQLSRARA